jgi:myo-inositol-1(or 4)-monophosphatase
MHPFVNIAVRAARKAGNYLAREFEESKPLPAEKKGRNDFVTIADQKAEKVIIDIIRESYPEHAIVAEESGAIGENDIVWVIDPIDGTTNFFRKLPHFAISIAIKIKGRVEHGVIYDPMRDELFVASRGSGVSLNDKRLRVAGLRSLDDSLLATGFPFRTEALIPKFMKTFESMITKCSDIRRGGSAALDLAYVAAGRLDGYWEYGLSEWDIAAGQLMVREAGGIVSDIDGTDKHLKTGNVLAASPRVYKEMIGNLNKA